MIKIICVEREVHETYTTRKIKLASLVECLDSVEIALGRKLQNCFINRCISKSR